MVAISSAPERTWAMRKAGDRNFGRWLRGAGHDRTAHPEDVEAAAVQLCGERVRAELQRKRMSAYDDRTEAFPMAGFGAKSARRLYCGKTVALHHREALHRRFGISVAVDVRAVIPNEPALLAESLDDFTSPDGC